jgi:DNA helicase-2/ATP-dependent DNA helicase PcrA
MSSWAEIRRQASDWHAKLHPVAGLPKADELLKAAQKDSGVKLFPVAAGDVLLDGAEACYDHDNKRIFISKGLSPELAAFYAAHEFGHVQLHTRKANCSGHDIDPCTPAEPEGSAVGEGDAYSPKQRTEAQANLFAREFLLPRNKIRLAASAGAISAENLAQEVGLPLDLVMQQMADALLLPEERDQAPRQAAPSLDDSQQAASHAPSGPHIVRAGPGTGKTRTLVGRVRHLVEDLKVDPGSIVALSYSNASAQDLADRIRAEMGDQAPAIWTGTFHAFGLELLRQHGQAIGLPSPPKLVDRTDALFLMEDLLDELKLDHYLDLGDPLRALKSVLAAIGRAKDELVTPEGYRAYAKSITDPLSQAKSLEAADIYEIYDRALRKRGMVDFGDLIMRSVELLEANREIADYVRTKYPHILVDEYQDMNRASGIFLGKLVKPGQGPWVVGDVRQAIYRFRGASPLNMSKFTEDFAGAAVLDLAVNYRSGGRIVRTFERFGVTMASAELATKRPLTPHRGESTGKVLYNIAATREAEDEGIAQAILADVSRGGVYRNHAILARTHGVLCRIAAHLERAGIPSLYFGDFFERPEIRDLLCLLSVTGERDGLGLMRVAQFPKYTVPVLDILGVFDFAAENDVSVVAALGRLKDVPGLSAQGAAGLGRLAADLAGIGFMTTPHQLLSRYLFCRDGLGHPALDASDAAGQQRRLAVYQLLQLAFEFKGKAGQDPKRGFLEHVRRLEILDEEKELRRLPAAANDLDAVRLMTVHASKGLEFPHVHLPSLSVSFFPPNAQANTCPPPPGLIPDDKLMTSEAEEQGLFFVGLSRARDSLSLSRAMKYGGWPRGKPTPMLEKIEGVLTGPATTTATWTAQTEIASAPLALKPASALGEDLTVYSVETYIECPRRFYYGDALGLSKRVPKSPYLKFQSVVRAGVSWLGDTPAPEREAGQQAYFEGTWNAVGPKESAFGPLFKASARRMLETARSVMTGVPLTRDRQVVVAGVTISVRSDFIHQTSGGVSILRLKSGRLAKTETKKERYALAQKVVTEQEGVVPAFEHISLITGDRTVITPSASDIAAAFGKVEDALDGMTAGRFEPKPNSRNCPTCPFYFLCPAHGIPA